MSQDIRELLNVRIESPFWDEALQKAATQEHPQWLTKNYIVAIDRDFALLGDHAEHVYQALSQVVENPALCLFAKILYHIIDKRKSFSESFPTFALPKAPEGISDPLGYDYVGLFPILAHVGKFTRELAERGVERDIACSTLNFLRNGIKNSCEQAGKPCFSEGTFSIYRVYLYTDTLWIGRLRFEPHPNDDRNVRVFTNNRGEVRMLMCDITLHATGNVLGAVGFEDAQGAFGADYRETEEYYEGYAIDPETCRAQTCRTRLSKKEWKTIMAPGDTLLKVHIPGMGKLLKADCDAAYERARRVYERCYPEYDFKGFICRTWLLCPTLCSFLKPDANIALFQQKYHIFPEKNTAADVLWYVFGVKVASADEVDPATLPEENSMQRGVKKLLLEGTYIHQYNGFIPF